MDDAINKYKTLSEKIFSESNKSNDSKATLGHEVFEREIKNVVATSVRGGQRFN